MKKGYLFFFNMGNITQAARIALIPAIVFLFLARGVFVLIALLFIPICLIFGAIKAPSDNKVMSTIESFHESFEERIRAKTAKKECAPYIDGYQIKGRMLLHRCVNNEIVYPTPMVVSIVQTNNGKEDYLMIGRMSLLRDKSEKFENFKFDSSNISLECLTDAEDDSVMVISINILETEESIKFVVQNNFRTREFLDNARDVLSKYTKN